MKFSSSKVAQGLLPNPGDAIGKIFQPIDPTKRLVLAMGYGMQDGPLPLRAVAYIIPVLRLLDQLPRSTRVDIYIATEGCIRANGSHMDPERLRQNAVELSGVIRKYVDACYPMHAAKVRVLMDRNIKGDAAVESALDCMMNAASDIYGSDATIRHFFETRGGVSALRYGAEHALYMRDPVELPVPIPLIVDGMDHDFDNIVMIGGPAERIFHRLRTALMEKLGRHTRWNSHQLFTHLGSPPCYHHQVGEPAWSERTTAPDDPLVMLRQTGQAVVKDMNEHLAVMWDLMVLLADAGGINDFRGLDAKAVRKDPAIDGGIVETLRRGWNKVRGL